MGKAFQNVKKNMKHTSSAIYVVFFKFRLTPKIAKKKKKRQTVNVITKTHARLTKYKQSGSTFTA